MFAPSPVVTVTIEHVGGVPEVHFHPGGQGFWVARMAAVLGADVTLCAPIGGEPGKVLAALLEDEPLSLKAVSTQGWTGVYVHDRREGERASIAEAPSATLLRHETDSLYGVALAAGLHAVVTLMTGPRHESVIDADVYRRLTLDLRANGGRVMADLTGPPLAAVLEAGCDLVKLNDDELVQAGWASGHDASELVGGLERLCARGAESALVTRGPEPALALADGRLLELRGPRFSAIDAHGSGDSMFAALGVEAARGHGLVDSLRMAVAAGALNATRRGLGTGGRAEIEDVARRVSIDELCLADNAVRTERPPEPGARAAPRAPGSTRA